MHPLPLVVFLTLAAGPDRTIPVGCREDYGTCREDCTIDYGGSTTKYRQLTQCLERCANEQSECTSRHYTLRDANIDLRQPAREPDPAMRETQTYDDDLREDDTEKPASRTGSDGVRRGVYRASEESPPARTEPAVKKEPEPEAEAEAEPAPIPAAPVKRAPEPASVKSEDVRVVDASEEEEPEPAPAPKPAPKPSEPLRPKPPPEPKKKDISEWDPNGD